MIMLADDIGRAIWKYYDNNYLRMLFSSSCIVIEDIIIQVLVICSRYAYLKNAEKHPIMYYIRRDGKDEDERTRKEIERTITYTEKHFDILEQRTDYGIDRPVLEKVKEYNRYPSYSISEFQYWEACNIHDMSLVKAIVERRLPSSKKISVDRFIEIANSYDQEITKWSMEFGKDEESTILSSLKLFTLQSKYSFDFFYKVAVEMEMKGITNIPDLHYRLMGMAGTYVCRSILPKLSPEYANEYDCRVRYPLILQRERLISSLLSEQPISSFDEKLAWLIEANVLVNAVISHFRIDNNNLFEWFPENTTLSDIESIFETYNVFRCFVSSKEWTDKRIQYVRHMYDAVSIDYKEE